MTVRREYLSLGIGWSGVIAEAEERARALMNASDKRYPPLDPEGEYYWWVETFGASRQEFEEMADALVRRRRQMPFWRIKRRREILHKYAKLTGLLTAGSGLTTVWV